MGQTVALWKAMADGWVVENSWQSSHSTSDSKPLLISWRMTCDFGTCLWPLKTRLQESHLALLRAQKEECNKRLCCGTALPQWGHNESVELDAVADSELESSEVLMRIESAPNTLNLGPNRAVSTEIGLLSVTAIYDEEIGRAHV